MVRLTSTLGLVAGLVGATVAASGHHDGHHGNDGHGGGHHHDGTPTTTTTGHLQMISYVKRRPDFTREAFWDYWNTQHAPKVAPLASYYNITRYQQIQAGGKILPTEAGADEPASYEPVDFDGIAVFLYESPEVLEAMLAHPYYVQVVEPDEHVFLDKQAFGAGMVATFVGTQVAAVESGEDVWVGYEPTRIMWQEVFNTYL